MIRRTTVQLIALLCGALAAISALPATAGLRAAADTTAPGSGPTHVVRRGETLAAIAAAHGVDPHMLEHANGISGGRVIVGTRLQLTPLPVPFSPDVSASRHVVGRGESLDGIARDHGTTVAGIKKLNHIHGWVVEPGVSLALPSGWVCPVPRSRFANDWAWVKPDGRTHEGIDMFAPRGSAIVAPVDGHLHQDEGPIGGLQFTLWGKDGVRYFGSHLESFGASGDVRAGDFIGAVGSSGNAAGTTPHLHFEAYPGDGDRSANPYPALRAACR